MCLKINIVIPVQPSLEQWYPVPLNIDLELEKVQVGYQLYVSCANWSITNLNSKFMPWKRQKRNYQKRQTDVMQQQIGNSPQILVAYHVIGYLSIHGCSVCSSFKTTTREGKAVLFVTYFLKKKKMWCLHLCPCHNNSLIFSLLNCTLTIL